MSSSWEDTVLNIMIGVMIFVGVAFILLLLSLPIVSNIGRTNGTHSGIITAAETNDFLFETQRAYFKTSLESTQEDTYCVQDSEVYEQLVGAARTGERLTIRFAHPLIEWRWNCGGDAAIIVGIEPSPETAP